MQERVDIFAIARWSKAYFFRNYYILFARIHLFQVYSNLLNNGSPNGKKKKQQKTLNFNDPMKFTIKPPHLCVSLPSCAVSPEIQLKTFYTIRAINLNCWIEVAEFWMIVWSKMYCTNWKPALAQIKWAPHLPEIQHHLHTEAKHTDMYK